MAGGVFVLCCSKIKRATTAMDLYCASVLSKLKMVQLETDYG